MKCWSAWYVPGSVNRPCIACMDFRSLSLKQAFEILAGRLTLHTPAEAVRELIRELSEPSQHGASPTFGHAENSKELARLVQVRHFGSPRTNH